jgi:phage terminase large subunit
LIGKTWVEEKRRKWGENSPLYIAKVLGDFPEQASDALVSLKDFREAVGREVLTGGEKALGVDVARFGDDSTVIYLREGQRARKVGSLQGKDLMQTVGLIVRCLDATKADKVRVDDIGLGGGVVDRLRELRDERRITADVIPVNVGERPTVDGATADGEGPDAKFLNLRAQINWGVRERFIAGEISIDDNQDLLAQASSIKYKYTSSAKIQIEGRADMKKRGLPSPDDWDALVLAFADIDSGYDWTFAWVGDVTKIGKRAEA